MHIFISHQDCILIYEINQFNFDKLPHNLV